MRQGEDPDLRRGAEADAIAQDSFDITRPDDVLDIVQPNRDLRRAGRGAPLIVVEGLRGPHRELQTGLGAEGDRPAARSPVGRLT
jgi:hypothetical protein